MAERFARLREAAGEQSLAPPTTETETEPDPDPPSPPRPPPRRDPPPEHPWPEPDNDSGPSGTGPEFPHERTIIETEVVTGFPQMSTPQRNRPEIAALLMSDIGLLGGMRDLLATSTRDGVEYGAWIYVDHVTGQFGLTRPVRGTGTGIDLGLSGAAQEAIGPGKSIVGSYHTHPPVPGSAGEEPSGPDDTKMILDQVVGIIGIRTPDDQMGLLGHGIQDREIWDISDLQPVGSTIFDELPGPTSGAGPNRTEDPQDWSERQFDQFLRR